MADHIPMMAPSTSQQDDLRLLHAYAEEGSDDAFARVVARNIDLVYSAARRQVTDPHVAEDVTQTVFILLARKSRQAATGRSLTAWLLAATRYVVADARKRQTRRTQHEMTAGELKAKQLQQGQPPQGPDPDVLPLLDDALGRLTPPDRDAVHMRFFEGLSFKQIGAALGATEHAATMRVSRALEKLREDFASRGVTVASAALATTLAHAVQAAPAGLDAAVTTAALAQIGASGAAATTTAATVVAATKLKLLAFAAALVLGLGGGGAYLVVTMRAERDPDRLIISGPGADTTGAGRGTPTPQLNDPARTGGPRELFRSIRADAYQELMGATLYGGMVGDLDRGDWVRFNSIDLGTGADRVSAVIALPDPYAGKTLEIRLDGPTGPLAGALKTRGTGGWNNFARQEVPLNSSIAAGVRDVYVVVSGGDHAGNLLSMRFSAAVRPQSRWVEGSDFRDVSAPVAAHASAEAGWQEVKLAPGQWARYGTFEFDGSAGQVSAAVAGEGLSPDATLELHLDSPGGPYLASIPVSSAVGGRRALRSHTTRLSIVPEGRRDVVVRLEANRGLAYLNGFRFLPRSPTGETLAPGIRPTTEPHDQGD
jgi:RNA polymerase sigma factor (sigma-70 family)